jgi:hypothetical protein
MKGVELYGRVRYAVRIEGLSERSAALRFGIDPRTVSKMLKFSVPPGYRRTKPPMRPKLDAFVATIDRILSDDRSRPPAPPRLEMLDRGFFDRSAPVHGPQSSFPLAVLKASQFPGLIATTHRRHVKRVWFRAR